MLKLVLLSSKTNHYYDYCKLSKRQLRGYLALRPDLFSKMGFKTNQNCQIDKMTRLPYLEFIYPHRIS